jgi:MFS family permease
MSTGLMMTIMPGVMVVIAPLSGRLADKLGTRMPTSIGMVILAIAVVGIGYSGQAHTIELMALSLAFFGVAPACSPPRTTARSWAPRRAPSRARPPRSSPCRATSA